MSAHDQDARSLAALPPVRGLAPVVLLAPPDFPEASALADELDAVAWSCLRAHDVDRARWLASIQKVAAVVVAGEARWAGTSTAALEGVTLEPLVVLADLSSPAVVDLLGAGVDSVLPAATDPSEVVARLVALLRRAGAQGPSSVRYLSAGRVLVDLHAQECTLGGRPLHLSPTEYRLLVYLMSHPQQALPTHLIVRRVWGWTHADGRNVLRIFVNRLRQKLGDPAADPTYVVSVRGIGYRFAPAVAELGEGGGDACDPAAVAPLVTSVSALTTHLLAAESAAEAADRLVTRIHESGYGEGVALLRAGDRRMELVASRGMSDAWIATVADGVPLDGPYASAHNVRAVEPVQLTDIQADRRFPGSAALAFVDGYHAVLLLPVLLGDRPWGQLGIARRSPRPFDAAAAAYLGCAAALFGGVLETDRATA